MEDPNQKAQRDLPGLRQWANNLLSLATEKLGKTKYSEKDHFGFMAFCFLSKQIDHMRAILALNESRDVGLIARSMLEGMCQLLWAAKDAETRALRWRTFAWIHDWRVMQGKILTGEVVDTERRTLIEEAVRQYGVLFLTEQARSNREKGKPLPKDPYHRNWTGKATKEIFDSVEGKTLYLKLYKPFSDWHHWSPGGLGAAIAREDNRVVYWSVSLAVSATALATGFQCLLQTVEVLDKHLNLGMSPKIAELRNEYVAWQKSPGSPKTKPC